jgi:hypothetical protein
VLNNIGIVDQTTATMPVMQRQMLASGDTAPSQELIDKATKLKLSDLPPVEGIQVIFVPTKASVWLHKKKSNSDGGPEYNAKICDVAKLAESPKVLHPTQTLDHRSTSTIRALLQRLATKLEREAPLLSS